MKMDIMEIEGEYETVPIFCFLCISWAIIADIDINSEACRCCGETRFTMWGVYRVLNTLRWQGSMWHDGKAIQNRNDAQIEALNNSEKNNMLAIDK